MKRIILISFLFLTAFAVSVVAHTPASFIISQAPKIRGLELVNVTGTIWHGQARKVVWNNINFGQVNWDFSPVKVVQGKAEYALRFGRGSDLKLTGTGSVGIGLDGPYAEKVLASIPAESALNYAAIPVPLDVKGSVDLTLHHVLYGVPWCKEASGALVWNEGQVDSPLGSLELGSVFTDFKCQDSLITAQGSHDVPQVSGAFSAELQSNMNYRVDSWFKPGAEFPDSLGSQLKWLGQPEGNGRYTFELSGKL